MPTDKDHLKDLCRILSTVVNPGDKLGTKASEIASAFVIAAGDLPLKHVKAAVEYFIGGESVRPDAAAFRSKVLELVAKDPQCRADLLGAPEGEDPAYWQDAKRRMVQWCQDVTDAYRLLARCQRVVMHDGRVLFEVGDAVRSTVPIYRQACAMLRNNGVGYVGATYFPDWDGATCRVMIERAKHWKPDEVQAALMRESLRELKRILPKIATSRRPNAEPEL